MYKVINLKDDVYQVVDYPDDPDYDIYEEGYTTCFQGSLSDCEAYIRLNEQGYM